MKKDVRYIAETKEFIVDGQVIKESSLTAEEKRILMESATSSTLITGQAKLAGTLLV